MTDCIFCRIIEGHVPARKVYEDEETLAFWDTNPASPVHILIVPKVHVPTLNDIPQGSPLLCHMGDVATRIAKELGFAETGYRFFINVGRGGGQVVFHLHAHLISGNDVGTFFIRVAIGAAILWRKLIGFLRLNRKQD